MVRTVGIDMETSEARQALTDLRQWAKDRLATGSQPPWAYYQYMKLVETADAILTGMAATTTADSPQLERSPGKHLRLVDSNYRPDTAQPHPVEPPVQMPM